MEQPLYDGIKLADHAHLYDAVTSGCPLCLTDRNGGHEVGCSRSDVIAISTSATGNIELHTLGASLARSGQ